MQNFKNVSSNGGKQIRLYSYMIYIYNDKGMTRASRALSEMRDFVYVQLNYFGQYYTITIGHHAIAATSEEKKQETGR